MERDISTNTFSAQIKAKEITGEDIEIDVGEIDTDVIVDVNINELARTEGIVSTETREYFITEIFHHQDPNMLATLTSKELEMLRSISQDDLAPPPSQEDIFGQIDAVKKQFEEDHELIARQFEENKVGFGL